MNARGEECSGTPPHHLCAGLAENVAEAEGWTDVFNCTRSPYSLNILFIFLEENT
jgi:hypothetical protein